MLQPAQAVMNIHELGFVHGNINHYNVLWVRGDRGCAVKLTGLEGCYRLGAAPIEYCSPEALVEWQEGSEPAITEKPILSLLACFIIFTYQESFRMGLQRYSGSINAGR